MFVQIIALGPKKALIRGSIVLHMLIKGNVENLQVSDSEPLWASCLLLVDFFQNQVFKKNSHRNIFWASNSLTVSYFR